MPSVRDDPNQPDEGFAELYQQLPDANDLWPWLELAHGAPPPVLYLGIGAGRLAVPLQAAGIQLVGVDSHPLMLAWLQQRLTGIELIHSRIEDLTLHRQFGLVMVPSNILQTVKQLRHAADHVFPGGALAAELSNPHWLQAGAGDGVRVEAMDGNQARIQIDYRMASGQIYTQEATIQLIWPDEVERWLGAAGLRLRRMFGRPELDMISSPSFYVVAGR
jgi:trans-aconitate methyltransferase